MNFENNENNEITSESGYINSCGDSGSDNNAFVPVTAESGENKLVIKIISNGGYNVACIDTKERTVKVIEADCGKRDCVYTAAITDSGGMIYCSPHQLRILPFDFETDDNIII